MIEQTFYFENRKILTIYHKGFSDYPLKRKIEKEEGNLKFCEKKVNANLEGSFSYSATTHGFLPASDFKNPYNNYSCRYEEFIVLEKDKSFIVDDLLKDTNQFNRLSKFVKEWSGYNLEKYPMSLNNILYFEPTEVAVSCSRHENKKSLQVAVEENKNLSELLYVIKFKKRGVIVDTKMEMTSEKVLTFKTNQTWNSADLELYLGDEMIYAYYDLKYLNEVKFHMGIVDRQIKSNLERVNKTIELRRLSHFSFQVGETVGSNQLESYTVQENRIREQLETSDQVAFLKTNEYERGLKILSEISETSNYPEMWIFDPYFINYEAEGGKKRINDILKVLGRNLGVSKKVVYEEEKGDFQRFKEVVGSTIEDLEEKGESLDFTFIETKEHFHDRFIFLKKEESIIGYLLGTSFNSLGDNYSTVVRLNAIHSELIFKTLVENLLNEEKINFHRKLVD